MIRLRRGLRPFTSPHLPQYSRAYIWKALVALLARETHKPAIQEHANTPVSNPCIQIRLNPFMRHVVSDNRYTLAAIKRSQVQFPQPHIFSKTFIHIHSMMCCPKHTLGTKPQSPQAMQECPAPEDNCRAERQVSKQTIKLLTCDGFSHQTVLQLYQRKCLIYLLSWQRDSQL